MTPLDWIFLSALAASSLLGAWRGLVYEILSLAGWVVAFVTAQQFADVMGALLPIHLSNPQDQAMWRHMAGFAIVFVATVFVCGLLAWGIKKLFESAGLRPADRALGAMFGVLRGGVLLLAVTLVVGWTPLVRQPWWQQSQGAPLLQAALHSVFHNFFHSPLPAVPESVKGVLPPLPVLPADTPASSALPT